MLRGRAFSIDGAGLDIDNADYSFVTDLPKAGEAWANLCTYSSSGGSAVVPAGRLQNDDLTNLGFSGQRISNLFFYSTDADGVATQLAPPTFVGDADGDGRPEASNVVLTPAGLALTPSSDDCTGTSASDDVDGDGLVGGCDPDPTGWNQTYVGFGSGSFPVTSSPWFFSDTFPLFGTQPPPYPHGGFLDTDRDGPPDGDDACPSVKSWVTSRANDPRRDGAGVVKKTQAFGVQSYRCACRNRLTGERFSSAPSANGTSECLDNSDSDCFREPVQEADERFAEGRGWRPIERPGCARRTDGWCDEYPREITELEPNASHIEWAWFEELFASIVTGNARFAPDAFAAVSGTPPDPNDPFATWSTGFVESTQDFVGWTLASIAAPPAHPKRAAIEHVGRHDASFWVSRSDAGTLRARIDRRGRVELARIAP